VEPVHKLNLSTFCTSRDDFIAQFRPFLDETTVLVPSKASLSFQIGHALAFDIALKDGTVMLSGRGRVIEVRDHGKKPSARPGLLVRIDELSPESLALKAEILAGKRKPMPRIVPKTLKLAPPLPPVVSRLPPPAQRLREPDATPLPDIPLDQRRPGAPDVLPANPLAEMSPSALVSFIECNLAEFNPEPGAPAVVLPPVDTIRNKVPIAPEAPPPPPVAPEPPPPPEPVEPPMAAADLAEDFSPPSWRARLAAMPPTVRVLAPMIATCLATLAACWALWGRSAAPPSAPPVPVPAAALQVPSPAPPPREAAPAPAPTPAPARPSGRCTAHIASRPSGAIVFVGEQRLGHTPLTARVSCEKATIRLTHPRYSPAVETVVPSAKDSQASLTVRLARPPAKLVLGSTPPNATFRVNGKKVGAGAREVTVLRFERARVEATLPGHRRWRQAVYVSSPTMQVSATLTPIAAKH
jgi:hypothetical protein